MRIIPTDSMMTDRMPMYNPEPDSESIGNRTYDTTIPQQTFKPRVEYPDDPQVKATDATVFVESFVDSSGTVRRVKVIKTDDMALNPYAVYYASQYKFSWPNRRVGYKGQWIVLRIHFKK